MRPGAVCTVFCVLLSERLLQKARRHPVSSSSSNSLSRRSSSRSVGTNMKWAGNWESWRWTMKSVAQNSTDNVAAPRRAHGPGNDECGDERRTYSGKMPIVRYQNLAASLSCREGREARMHVARLRWREGNMYGSSEVVVLCRRIQRRGWECLRPSTQPPRGLTIRTETSPALCSTSDCALPLAAGHACHTAKLDFTSRQSASHTPSTPRGCRSGTTPLTTLCLPDPSIAAAVSLSSPQLHNTCEARSFDPAAGRMGSSGVDSSGNVL